jgi:hypothetical protein
LNVARLSLHKSLKQIVGSNMSNGKKNRISKELMTDILMVILLACAITLLALVL